jgi:hypothetical protein
VNEKESPGDDQQPEDQLNKGIVSDRAPPVEEIVDQVLEEKKARPARVRRAPAWLATDEWDRRFT